MKRQASKKGVPAPRPSGNRITSVSVSRQWEGPLPNPEALERFDQVVPNGAERICKMAEVEQAHRVAYQTEALRVSVAEAKRGQYLGAIISILAVASALGSVWIGAHWAVSMTFLGLPLMALVMTIVGSRSENS